MGKDALGKRDSEEGSRLVALVQNTRPELCSGARDEPRSRVPGSSLRLEAPWIRIPASPGCLPCPGVGMCPPAPFCQCSVAQGRLLELAQSSRLRWCLPSALGSRHIPWDGGSSLAHPALPTRSWSCREAAPGAGESQHPAGTWGFLSSWNLQLQLPREGNAWQGWPGMAGDSPGWGEGAPTAASGKGFGAQGGHEGLGGAAQGEGTARGRKCLAELKLLAKDPEFWAELGQDLSGNIGLERERSSPASWGLVSPLGATCPSRGGVLCLQEGSWHLAFLRDAARPGSGREIPWSVG